MKLLLPVKGLDEFVEVSEDFSGDVALQAAHDLSFALAFEGATGDVGAGSWVGGHAHEHDAPECSLARRSPRGLSRLRLINPDDASIGALPQR